MRDSIVKGLARMVPDKSDTLLFTGMGLLFYGIYQIYIPAAFMTIGVLLIVIAALPYFAPAKKVSE